MQIIVLYRKCNKLHLLFLKDYSHKKIIANEIINGHVQNLSTGVIYVLCLGAAAGALRMSSSKNVQHSLVLSPALIKF